MPPWTSWPWVAISTPPGFSLMTHTVPLHVPLAAPQVGSHPGTGAPPSNAGRIAGPAPSPKTRPEPLDPSGLELPSGPDPEPASAPPPPPPITVPGPLSTRGLPVEPLQASAAATRIISGATATQGNRRIR